MSNTAIWTNPAPASRSPACLRGNRGLRPLGALLLAAGLALGGWCYRQNDRTWVPAAASCAGTGLVVLSLAGTVSASRKAWERQRQQDQADWESKLATLEAQLLKSRQAEALAQKTQAELWDQTQKVQELTRHRDQLQTELDQLKRNQLAQTQQRQVLESSKTVLELHVQARMAELQKLQRRYEMILNSVAEGICGLDLEGKATFANPAVARITGWKVEELIGKTEQEVFAPEAQARGADANAGEGFFHRKDGSRFPVEFVRSPIEENGRQTGTVLTFKDITQRKRAEETLAQKAAELTRSNAELEQFAFVASHDLQEPLRKILAFGDRVKAKCDGVISPEAKDYLERMQSAAARMRTLIDDLLAFSRVIRSGAPFAPVNLAVVTKEVLGDLEMRLEKTGARVEVGELPTVEADPMQMRQLLLNLLGNALKFQAPGAKPLIQVRSRSFTSAAGLPLVELAIQDNGIGFEEKYSEKVFVVFQRLHGRGEYEGTGIGLAVCRRITDRHQGTITVKSQPGEGSTFFVTLPVRQTPVTSAA